MKSKRKRNKGKSNNNNYNEIKKKRWLRNCLAYISLVDGLFVGCLLLAGFIRWPKPLCN